MCITCIDQTVYTYIRAATNKYIATHISDDVIVGPTARDVAMGYMAADGEQQQSRARCTWETALLLCIIDKLLDVQIHHGRQQKRISA